MILGDAMAVGQVGLLVVDMARSLADPVVADQEAYLSDRHCVPENHHYMPFNLVVGDSAGSAGTLLSIAQYAFVEIHPFLTVEDRGDVNREEIDLLCGPSGPRIRKRRYAVEARDELLGVGQKPFMEEQCRRWMRCRT